jgi:CheY-like chemotaxis protein
VAARLLEKQGHRVTIAANGKRAVEQFERGSFDLILMDVQMPEMDGVEATVEIRRIEQSRKTRIPIIAMTAQTMKGDRDSCFAAGMDGFVSKPIRLPELWAAIKALKAPAG